MLFAIPLAAFLLPIAISADPTVRILNPQATIIGSSANGVDSFNGIPFAEPPVGQLRLKPPKEITHAIGTIKATGTPVACPQFTAQVTAEPSADMTFPRHLERRAATSGENCLTLNVQRPSSLKKARLLPVVFWIYGGGFEIGSTQMYDATYLINTSIVNGNEIVYVATNYRVGGFGWMPGKEILADGSANLGMLDQRKALEWVAENIEQFGGDPAKVTIWGESAGSISVFNQMAMYNGNNTYRKKPLFRGGVMDSGSIVPTNPVDCPKAQAVYDTVVKNAGCANAVDSLECLRNLSYNDFVAAADSVPASSGYDSIALSYTPRPDGTLLTASPELLVERGHYAKIPFIVGDQEDEGTAFTMNQKNISTTNELVTYLSTVFFPSAPRSRVAELVSLYPDNPAAGSPFRTGQKYEIYPQYKRLSAILGDTFTLVRRIFLHKARRAHPKVLSWSYLASYDHDVPINGTTHGSDVARIYGLEPGFPSSSIMAYYLSFFNTLNPNEQSDNLTHWPRWGRDKELLHFKAESNGLIKDDFRNEAYQFLRQKRNVLRI